MQQIQRWGRWQRCLGTLFFCFSLQLLSILAAAEQDADSTSSTFSLADVRPMMQHLLHQHVSQKEMTPEIMQRACQLFLEQFDKRKVYLLTSDVARFSAMSEHELKRSLRDYEENRFPIFERMRDTIQSSITRARRIRATFHDLPPGGPDALIPYDTFAATTDDLKRRQRADFTYLANLTWSHQVTKDHKSWERCVQTVDTALTDAENEYMGIVGPRNHEQTLAFHILRALASSLDAHSSFFNKTEADELRVRLERSFAGIGLELGEEQGGKVVTSILPDSPASECGRIKPGDLLISIDGQPIKDLTIQETVARIHGDVGKPVRLGFRGKSGSFEVVLAREEIILKKGRVDVSSEPFQGGVIAKLALHAFYQSQEASGVTSEQDMRQAIYTLAQKGPIRGLLLDLRDNHGGFLMQAVQVAGLFIKSGVIVACKYSDGSIHCFRDVDPNVIYPGPVVVLISRETASAAEIVAAALKDYGVAVIVGDDHTFGKGSIQAQTVTTDTEPDSFFKVTVGTYYGVAGESIQLKGVHADIVVPGFFESQKIGEAYLANPLPADKIPSQFHDTLADIPVEGRAWYQQYYIPFLQEPTSHFRKWIPKLVQESSKRMRANTTYQTLLQKEQGTHPNQDGSAIVSTLSSAERSELNALQLQEAVNILKDLVTLSEPTKER